MSTEDFNIKSNCKENSIIIYKLRTFQRNLKLKSKKKRKESKLKERINKRIKYLK